MFFTSAVNTTKDKRRRIDAYIGRTLHAPVEEKSRPRRIGVTVWADMLAA